MPEPRADRALAASVRVTIETTSYAGEAIRQRRHRAGKRAPQGVPIEVRNGLPEFVPYVYRGSDRDA